MPDIAKWTETVSWLSTAAVVAGSFVAGLFGIRALRRAPPDDQRAIDIKALEARVIEEARARALVEAKLRDADLRKDFADAVASARRSFDGELNRIETDLRREIGELENDLHDLERLYNGLNVKVEVMRGTRRPAGRD